MIVDELTSALDVIAKTDETLADAASRMRFNDIGCLPVLEHGALIGVLTERDLCRAIADGIDPERTAVSEYMTTDPVVVATETDMREAARLMVEAGVRHLPILKNDILVGVVSIRDLLAELLWRNGSTS